MFHGETFVFRLQDVNQFLIEFLAHTVGYGEMPSQRSSFDLKRSVILSIRDNCEMFPESRDIAVVIFEARDSVQEFISAVGLENEAFRSSINLNRFLVTNFELVCLHNFAAKNSHYMSINNFTSDV